MKLDEIFLDTLKLDGQKIGGRKKMKANGTVQGKALTGAWVSSTRVERR